MGERHFNSLSMYLGKLCERERPARNILGMRIYVVPVSFPPLTHKIEDFSLLSSQQGISPDLILYCWKEEEEKQPKGGVNTFSPYKVTNAAGC